MVILPLAFALLQPALPAPTAAWEDVRYVTTPAPCLRHAALVELLPKLAAAHPGTARLEKAGSSAEGRDIHLLTVGEGPVKVLLWSQMHGDEPSATPALLDLANALLTRSDDPVLRRIRERLTLLMVPMLNPDGTERYERRNAQGIDVNRDALNLATPEGRLLKELRDRHQPLLGFNLHDQDRRTVVGEGGSLATLSLLAVAGDEEGTMSEGRARAKRVASAMVAAMAPVVGIGSIGRYDEDWSPRAFGDNLTAWGTPVVLLESGGLPPGRPLTELTRLNYLALHAALGALAEDDAARHGPEAYEALTRNVSDAWADVVVAGALLQQPPTGTPYRADLAYDVEVTDAARAGCPADGEAVPPSRIVEVGDARFLSTARRIDATGLVIRPALEVAVAGPAAWLDAGALDALARLGVGRLRWHVGPSDAAPAAVRASAMAGPVRPSVDVVGAPAPTHGVLRGRPPAAGGRRVRDLLAALGAAPTPPSPAWPPLRPGEPASFLLVRPEGSDAGHGVVEAIVLGGQDVPLR